MCIQKLFIIKMMYSGIKLMVSCIAYHFRMRVDVFKKKPWETPSPVQLKGRSASHFGSPVAGCGLLAQLSVDKLDPVVWCLDLTLSVLCIMVHELSQELKDNWVLSARVVLFYHVVRIWHFSGMSWEGLKLRLLCTSQIAAWIAKYFGWNIVREFTLEWNMVLPR